jgi:hypothetical protein
MAVHGETHGIMGLSRPTVVVVWRSGDITGLGFPAASGLRQSGSYLGGLVWRCGFGARRSEAPKVRRSGDRGWVISVILVIWRSSARRSRRSAVWRSGLEARVCLIFGRIRCN